MIKDLMHFGFARVACAAPAVSIAQPHTNARRIAALAAQLSENGAGVVLFPELSLTGYSCEDLFLSDWLYEASYTAMDWLRGATQSLASLLVVGGPIRANGRQFNGAWVLSKGEILGVVPKTYIPNTGEFHEKRWFSTGAEVDLPLAFAGQPSVRLSTRQLFRSGRLSVGVELCEDLWAPLPPSTFLACSGANLVLNLSASNATVGKRDYRRALVLNQSARLRCAYAYASAGASESTKDVVYSGHLLIAEDGELLAEQERLAFDAQILYADIDVQRLEHERITASSFGDAPIEPCHVAHFALPPTSAPLRRHVTPQPFVPADGVRLDERAEEVFAIQAAGLARRILATKARCVVVGISGGLDSTLALLVCTESMRLLKRPVSDIRAYSLPAFGSSPRTRQSAARLAAALGVTFAEIPLHDAVLVHFRDIAHPVEQLDVTYENAQARMRTLVLMNLANQSDGFVVGTGDLSELALGWCTYNGDHMSGYGVNASVPKTLVKHLVRWFAKRTGLPELTNVLTGILATPISPELLPPSGDGSIVQATEDIVGPYEVHDFFIYHLVRHGCGFGKIRFLAELAFGDSYSTQDIARWLSVFRKRFFAQQFKRTTLPAGVKVGSVSFSPRGDWRMPDEVESEEVMPCL